VGPQYDVDVVDDLGVDQLCACSLVAAGELIERGEDTGDGGNGITANVEVERVQYRHRLSHQLH